MDQIQGIDHKRFDWSRFWMEQGQAVDLSDGGYLCDPKWALGSSDLRTLQDLSGMRAMALLGEPGMGKSVALDMEVQRQQADGANDAIIFYADLRAYSSDALLNAKVFESPGLTRWKEGADDLVLYLDSLDEALLRIETVATFIANELPRLPTERLSVRIACRTLDWHAIAPMLNPVFESIWGKGAFGAFEIAPLRRKEVVAAAAAWPVDVDEFMKQVSAANVVPFAIKPLTLNLLLRLFHSGGQLPASIAELYRRGCLVLCEEQSASRRAPRRDGRLAPAERAQLAGRIAAVSMLANRYAVWTGLESVGGPEEDVVASALAVGAEVTSGRAFEVTIEALREVLDTGLFSSRGADRMGWAHQSYAEFLTAEYLIARRVSARNVLDVLRHPSGGLVPQLSMVAAWAASLDKELRSELIKCEPVVLIHGDLTGWNEADRGALAAALLQALNEDRAHDFAFGMDARYRKLAHPGLSAIVRPYLVQATYKAIARRVAIRIAEACSLTDLCGELLAVASDENTEDHVRSYAVSALATCGDDRIWPALRPLALAGAGFDRNRDIKGQAPAILWPRHLDAKTLFQNISPPRDSYYGAYANFLSRTLPDSLQRADLPAALRWATEFTESSDNVSGHHLKQLADGILRRAWPYIQDPEITLPVLHFVQTAIRKHHNLTLSFESDDSREFSKNVASDAAGRRVFLRQAIAARFRDHSSYWLFKAGLLTRDDLPWLLDLRPSGRNAANDVDEVTLLEFVQSVANLNDDVDFAAIYDAAQRWPLLRTQYASVVDGVALNSAEVMLMRKHHEISQRRRPKIHPPPAVRVAEQLARFEAGDLNGWWLLCRELTLDDDSSLYGEDFRYEITLQPGWVRADETLRRRIVAAAKTVLDQAEPTIDQWMGGNSANLSDLAAYRALVLLREEAPEEYRNLDAATWARWAPLVITVPKGSGTDRTKLHDGITADAVAAAPDTIASTVSALIRKEREQPPVLGQIQNCTMPPFYFLNQLGPNPEYPHLIAVLKCELESAQNTPAQYGALLSFLVRSGSRDAIDHGLSQMRPWPCPPAGRDLALTVAATLLEDGGLNGWPVIWLTMQADQDFGQELFLRLAEHRRFDAGRFAALPEAEHGDVYVWFEQVFPHQLDAEREGVHWVSPREAVGQLRDGILGVLVRRGTPEAVAALRSALSRLPTVPWLAYRLLEADQIMRQRTWQPLSPVDVFRLVDNADGRLVQSPEQLAEVLVEVLREYEAELHGEQHPVNALWNRELHGSEMHPKEEDALSDHVKAFLQRALVDRGIILNREVEIGRVPGAAAGSRTDIRVDAVCRVANGDRFDTITAIIETKGCWNSGLKTAMQTQLHDDYLIRTGAPVGIYLIGWFDKAKWTANDRRRNKTPNWSVSQAQQYFDAKAAQLTSGFVVRAVVVDCHAP